MIDFFGRTELLGVCNFVVARKGNLFQARKWSIFFKPLTTGNLDFIITRKWNPIQTFKHEWSFLKDLTTGNPELFRTRSTVLFRENGAVRACLIVGSRPALKHLFKHHPCTGRNVVVVFLFHCYDGLWQWWWRPLEFLLMTVVQLVMNNNMAICKYHCSLLSTARCHQFFEDNDRIKIPGHFPRKQKLFPS